MFRRLGRKHFPISQQNLSPLLHTLPRPQCRRRSISTTSKLTDRRMLLNHVGMVAWRENLKNFLRSTWRALIDRALHYYLHVVTINTHISMDSHLQRGLYDDLNVL
jgi:hypothetical protein